MRTFPALRQRTAGESVHLDTASGTISKPIPNPNPPSKNVVTGAMARIAAGLFGYSNPRANMDAEVPSPGPKALYQFHEGDLFLPGAQNFVLDPFQELPMQTIWGHGFMRTPNVFNPEQPQPVAFIPPGTTYVRIAGVGGLVSGQMATQPLMSNGD